MRIHKCRRIQKHSQNACAYENVSVQALTIRARRALHSALLLSQAEDLVLILLLKVLLLHLLVLKWDLFSDPPSLYGRRVRRTGTAGGTGTP